jgi:Subtilase family
MGFIALKIGQRKNYLFDGYSCIFSMGGVSISPLVSHKQSAIEPDLKENFMQVATDPKGKIVGDRLMWRDTPTGLFTGIDYRLNDACQGLDPYFIWADINGFAGLRKPGQDPKTASHFPLYLPIMIKLGSDVSPLELSVFTNVEPNKPTPLVLLSPRLGNPIEADLQKGAVIPARATAEFFKQFSRSADLRKLITFIELDALQSALPPAVLADKLLTYANNLMAAQRPTPPETHGGDTTHQDQLEGRLSKKLTGKVIAFIDDGCAFAHANFLKKDLSQPGAPLPRVRRLWDMNVRAAGSVQVAPVIFQPLETPAREFGREFTDADLKSLIVRHTQAGRIDEDGVYAEFASGTQYNINRLRGRMAHGTHVMDLACGPRKLDDTISARKNAANESPTWKMAVDDASQAPVVLVRLPVATVQDTTLRRAMQQDVIHALEYIIDACANDAEIVVNLSWGTFAGPHTGTNLLEKKIDQLVSLHGKRLKVVLPAGNGYQSRTHANFELAVGQEITLQWRTQPDDAAESYLELWMEQGAELELDITPPYGGITQNVKLGDVLALDYVSAFDGATNAVMGVCYDPAIQGALGPGPGIVLALAPSTSLGDVRTVAPHGVWKVKVTNTGSKRTVVDGYIERNDDAADTRSGTRQSYFDDALYVRTDRKDTTGLTLPVAPANTADTYVRREGVFNSLATGKKAIVAGGERRSDGKIAEYSPDSLDFNNTRRNRPGTPQDRKLKLKLKTTEESLTLHGVRAAGTRSGSVVRIAGTSMAAPQVARDLVG